jgi:hypothetical protein
VIYTATYHAEFKAGREMHELPLGVDPWHGADRASWILPTGLYVVRTDERPARDWGLLWIGSVGEWFFQSRCGRVIGSPVWWLDRRPENTGPVIHRRKD